MYKIGKYILDEQQTNIVLDESKHLLVVAGAGSGKTLTILGKIDYLIKEKHINPKNILCISFTKEASNSLKNKLKKELNIDLNVYTFHKLGLEIIKKYENFDITDEYTLDNIIEEFFKVDCFNKYNLKNVLKFFELPNKKEYAKFLNNKLKFNKYLILFKTFIHLFKANDYKLEDFIVFLNKAKSIFNWKNYYKEKAFLKLTLNIYLKYQSYLKENGEIDFDDMLIKSRKYVERYGFNNDIKYVIIDEFQDTSKVRFNLIKAILDKTGARLMVVGDDFQSIYRFTGCDLDVFVNFQNYFNDSKIMKIETTYRNSQELITSAGLFIMKNKQQIKKNLKSDKHIKKPIKIVYYNNATKSFKNLLTYLNKLNKNNILVIGRNNKDIYKYIDKDFKYDETQLKYLNHLNMSLRYLTAHTSKGLEEDDTIIINMEDSLLGFPSQIEDSKVLRFVSNKTNTIKYDEERRLFYVALTRTKNNVYLLVPKNNPSMFIQELVNDYKNLIEILKI